MNDRKLYSEIQKCRQRGVDVSLVTVVETKGSTPRGVGAKMAILPNGECYGTIGGGCVEAKIKTTALRALIEEKKTQSVTAYLNDPLGSQDGDICGGTMIMLIEYLAACKKT